MKRMKLWLCCGLLLALLGGCGDDAKTPDGSLQGQSPDQNVSQEEVGDDVEVTLTDVPEVKYESIPKSWENVDEKSVLWHVPNTSIEASEPYAVFQMGGSAYICRKNGEVCRIIKMDLSDGTALQDVMVELSRFSEVQALESGFVIYDMDQGNVVVIDADLQVKGTFSTRYSRGEWYFGKDGTVLYDFHQDGKMAKIDLTTGNRETLLKNMQDWHTIGKNENYVNFYYTDTEEQTVKYLSLNLQTGELSEMPFNEDVAYLYRVGDTWLGRSHLLEERYMICREHGEAYEIASEKYEDFEEFRKMYLMSLQEHMLTIAEDGTKLMLHDYDGKFISECQMPEGYHVTFDLYNRDENCFIWDEVHGGYYFLGYEISEDGEYYHGDFGGTEDHLEQKIFFWDIHADVDAEDLQLKAYDLKNPSGITVSSSLYERAKQLSEKYHVDIKIADKANSKFEMYYYYHGNAVMEENLISEGLDLLESVLQEKGADYFKEKILCSTRERLEIHLIEDIVAVSGTSNAVMYSITKYKYDYFSTHTQNITSLYVDVDTMTEENYATAFSELEVEK